MRHGRSDLRVAAALASAGLILSGCTNDPPAAPPTTSVPPGTTAPTTTAPAATTTTTTTSPPTPTPSDTDAAMAAAQRYFAAFNDAIGTTRTTEFRKTFIRGCVICGQDADKLDEDARERRTIEGGRLSFVDARVEFVQPPNIGLIGRVVMTKMVVRDATGKVVESYEPTTNPKRVLVRNLDGQWLVEGFISG